MIKSRLNFKKAIEKRKPNNNTQEKIQNDHFDVSSTEILNDENVNDKIRITCQLENIIPIDTVNNCEDVTTIVKVEISKTIDRNRLKDDVVVTDKLVPLANEPFVQENEVRQSTNEVFNLPNSLFKKNGESNYKIVPQVTEREVKQKNKIKESIPKTVTVNDEIDKKEHDRSLKSNVENVIIMSEAAPLKNIRPMSEGDHTEQPDSNKNPIVKATDPSESIRKRSDQSNCKENNPKKDEDENVASPSQRKNHIGKRVEPKKTTRNKSKKTVELTKKEKILDNQRSGPNLVGRAERGAANNNNSKKNTRTSMSGATMFVPSLMLSFNGQEEGDMDDTDSNEGGMGDTDSNGVGMDDGMEASDIQQYDGETHGQCDSTRLEHSMGISHAPDETITYKSSDQFKIDVPASNEPVTTSPVRIAQPRLVGDTDNSEEYSIVAIKSKENSRDALDKSPVNSTNKKAYSNITSESQKFSMPTYCDTASEVVTNGESAQLDIYEEQSANTPTRLTHKTNLRNDKEKTDAKSFNKTVNFCVNPVDTTQQNDASHNNIKKAAAVKETKLNKRTAVDKPPVKSTNKKAPSNIASESQKSPMPTYCDTAPVVVTPGESAQLVISQDIPANRAIQNKFKRSTRSNMETPTVKSSNEIAESNITSESRRWPDSTESETLLANENTEKPSAIKIVPDQPFNRTVPKETKQNTRSSTAKSNIKSKSAVLISNMYSTVGPPENCQEDYDTKTCNRESKKRTSANKPKITPRNVTDKSNSESSNEVAKTLFYTPEVIKRTETANGKSGNPTESLAKQIDPMTTMETINVMVPNDPSAIQTTVVNDKELDGSENPKSVSVKPIVTKKPKFNIRNAIDKSKTATSKSTHQTVASDKCSTVEWVQRKDMSNVSPQDGAATNETQLSMIRSDMENEIVESSDMTTIANISSTVETLGGAHKETSNDVDISNEAFKIGAFDNPESARKSDPSHEIITDANLIKSKYNNRSMAYEYSTTKVLDETDTLDVQDTTVNDLTESPVTPKFKVNLRNAVGKANVKSPNEQVNSNKYKKSQMTVANENALTIISTEEARLKLPLIPLQNDDNDNQSVMSSSSTARQRREKGFVLKRHSTIVTEHEQDTSKMTLKELLNVAAMMPPPTNRKSTKKPNSVSQTDSMSVADGHNEDASVDTGVSKCKKLRLDMDGRIVIDELDNKPILFNREGMDEIVVGVDELTTTYRSFSKRKLSGKRWHPEETKNFYSALMALGTNFSAMASVFKGRSRDELKKKFKVEEKRNATFIDQILLSQTTWNISALKFESHITEMDSKKKRKQKQDAVKRSWHSDSDSNGDTKDEVEVPKKRRRFEASTSKLDCTASVVPDYLSVILK